MLLSGARVKEKKTAALFVVTFSFIGYARRNTRRDKKMCIRDRAWDVASLMDLAVPVVACLLVWLVVNRG